MKITFLAVLIVISGASLAGEVPEDAYELKGDLLVTTIGDYLANRSEFRRLCERLPMAFTNKLLSQEVLSPEFRDNPDYILSDEEYAALVGDARGFVYPDISSAYSREKRTEVGIAEFFDFAKLMNTNEYDDVFMLCGHSLGPAKTLATGASTRVSSVAGFYLIDRHGVDRISSDGWSLKNGEAVREFGTMSAYVPGDKTRELGWRMEDQTLLIYESIKNTRNSKVETIRKDAISLPFLWDSERTHAAGGLVVWRASEPPLQNTSTCVRWEREVSAATCIQTRTDSRQFFMTEDFALAKKIFEEISPDARMVSRDDSSTNCVSGSICEHPGGAYVDAIIRGDMEGFRQLDIGASGFLRDKIDELGIVGELLFAPHFDDETLSPFDSFIVEYLHEYKKNPTHCFKPGSQSLDFKGVTEKLVEVDGMGNRTGHTYGGITLTSHYKINPEFFGICQQVCGLRNGGTEQLAGSTPVLLAARKFRETYDCKSKEVQDFERNLIDFYGRKSEIYEFEVTRNSW